MSAESYSGFGFKCECGEKLERIYTPVNSFVDGVSGGDGSTLRERLLEGMSDGELDTYLSTDTGLKAAQKYINIKKREGDLASERSNGLFDDVEPDGRWATTFAINDETETFYNPKHHGRA